MAGKEKQRISSAEIASFCNQIGLILEAGLPLYDGLESMCISVKGTKEEALYKAVFDGFNETGSLHSALKKEGSWPDYMTELIGIGEQTGQLEYVVKGLAVYYERESRLRSAITSAVTYPLVLGVLLVIIVLTMIWKVLPVFQRVLNSMGTELSGAGSAMIRLHHCDRRYCCAHPSARFEAGSGACTAPKNIPGCPEAGYEAEYLQGGQCAFDYAVKRFPGSGCIQHHAFRSVKP